MENLIKLYEDHRKLYDAYNENVTRPNEAKFHLDRAWEILKKIMLIKNDLDDIEIFEKTVWCFLA